MATQHLTDDELILHYYGETAPTQEQRAAAHLEACGPCRGEYARLQHVLGVIDESAVAVEPPPSFERTVWARLEPNLRPARRGWVSWLMSPAPLGLAAAVVVLVVGAFFAGRALSPAPSPSDAATAAARGTDSRAHSSLRPRRASRSLADGPRGAGQRRRGRDRRHLGRTLARRAAGGRQPALSADRGRRPATWRSASCSTKSSGC